MNAEILLVRGNKMAIGQVICHNMMQMVIQLVDAVITQYWTHAFMRWGFHEEKWLN